LIPAVAARNLIVIARDRHIRTRPQEVERFREVGLRVFWIAGKRDMTTWGWLAGKRDMTTWGWLARLVRHWAVIERVIVERGDGPWFYAVNDQSVREMNL
jgi:hypothetical protein